MGESVASALEALAENPTGDITPRAIVEAARRAMVSTFDESVHEVLLEQMPDLDHLDTCDPFAADRADDDGDEQPVSRRLGHRSAEELVAELRVAASDCLAVERVLVAEGEDVAASRLAHQNLATVDLRWDLARGLDPASWAEVGRDGNAFATLRRELISLVGSAEMETLWRTFESAAGE